MLLFLGLDWLLYGTYLFMHLGIVALLQRFTSDLYWAFWTYFFKYWFCRFWFWGKNTRNQSRPKGSEEKRMFQVGLVVALSLLCIRFASQGWSVSCNADCLTSCKTSISQNSLSYFCSFHSMCLKSNRILAEYYRTYSPLTWSGTHGIHFFSI